MSQCIVIKRHWCDQRTGFQYMKVLRQCGPEVWTMQRVLHAAGAVLVAVLVGCSGGDGPPDVSLTSIDLTPASATLQEGTTQQFTATGRFSDGSSGPIAVTWSSTGGTTSATGVYTAGSVAGNFQVVATEQGGSISAAAAVTVTAVPPVLTSISVAPATVSLAPGATQQFTATGHYSGGGTGSVAVSWSATGGTVSGGGLYTAGAVDGPYQVTATATGGAITGSASVTITTPPPNLVAIEVSPTGVRVKRGESRLFTAVGRLSDGGTAPVLVDWTVTTSPSPVTTVPLNASPLNSVGPSGLFTAGNADGTFTVTATVQGGTLAGTVTVNIHDTGGETVQGPLFWSPVAGRVYLCTSNHFTDDAVSNGGVATITATPIVGTIAPPVAYSNLGAKFYSDGSGTVKVVCQQVWEAPAGLPGTVQVTIDVVSNRPGTGMAKVFLYTNPCLTSDCRAGFTSQLPLPDPNWTTLPVSATVTVSATTGANIWFKNTDVP
jgi:hypothetical protein